MALRSNLRGYFHNEYQPGEKALVRKIDFFILTFCCLSYFTNYLDRSNLTNAYVTGMKEDLDFRGNQLTQVNAAFTAGYVVGQVPANLSLYYVRPRIFFPGCMVVWAGLTMVTAATHTPQAVAAIRFFQGVFEATTFVGTHYILGSWYTERELGKRSGIFTSSGLAGTLIGGFIQTGIQARLDGKSGLAGWRWLFIIDGLITLPIALYGLLFFPDTPATTTAVYLSPAQKALAQSRVPPPSPPTSSPSTSTSSSTSTPSTSSPSSSNSTSPLTLTFLRKTLTHPLFWGFTILWTIAGETESFSSNGLFALYLKASPTKKYTYAQLNDYPTAVPAIGIVSTLFWAALTDVLGGSSRALVGYFIGVTGVVTSALILHARGTFSSTGTTPTATVFGAYYWAGAVYACQATFFAWANDACRYEDHMFRAVVLAAMNLGNNVVNAWWSIVFYGADMAPWFRRGMYAMIAVSIALAIWTAGLSYMTKRHSRKRQAELGSSSNAVDQTKEEEREEKKTEDS